MTTGPQTHLNLHPAGVGAVETEGQHVVHFVPLSCAVLVSEVQQGVVDALVLQQTFIQSDCGRVLHADCVLTCTPNINTLTRRRFNKGM